MAPHIRLTFSHAVARLTLARPEARNAFDAQMLDEITAACEQVRGDATCRLLVIDAEGPTFCAGADINWMRSSGGATEAENRAEARRLGGAFLAMHNLAIPVVALVQGAALGGGTGLAAAADIVIASSDARFGFTEVRLGIVPAVISPFALRKIGSAETLRWFQSGEVFSAQVALRIGLVSEIVEPSALSESAAALTRALLSAAPQAQRIAKQLALGGAGAITTERMEQLAQLIAEVRSGSEAQAGLAAFLEKRPAPWSPGA